MRASSRERKQQAGCWQRLTALLDAGHTVTLSKQDGLYSCHITPAVCQTAPAPDLACALPRIDAITPTVIDWSDVL